MLTLPYGYSKAELKMAHRIADRFHSEELQVFWTASPSPAEEEPDLRVFGLTVMAIGSVVTALTSTLAALGRAAARSGHQ